MKTQGSHKDVVFLSGVRTGFGTFGGTLKDLSAIHLGPAPLEDLLWEALKDPQCGFSMAETAENLAEQYKLTRQAVDEVALASQQRAKQAWDACVFQDEVVPVAVKQKGQTVEFRKDEHMRPETTLEVLPSLNPYVKQEGLVTGR